MSEHNLITYNSIYLLSVLNYDRYLETGDPAWLESNHKKGSADYEKIWDDIENEITDNLGIDLKTKDEITLKNDLLILEIDLALTGDNKLKNKIRRVNQQLEDIENEREKTKKSILRNLLEVGMTIGIRLDPSTTTVAEYIEAIKTAKEIAEAKKSSQQKSNRNEH